jgi:hypothetical protein
MWAIRIDGILIVLPPDFVQVCRERQDPLCALTHISAGLICALSHIRPVLMSCKSKKDSSVARRRTVMHDTVHKRVKMAYSKNVLIVALPPQLAMLGNKIAALRELEVRYVNSATSR